MSFIVIIIMASYVQNAYVLDKHNKMFIGKMLPWLRFALNMFN